jgi:Spy/CpxP family protein refolding chaperone
LRKLFAAIFVGAALLTVSFAPVAAATKEDHANHGGNVTENCSTRSEDQPFFTFGQGNGKTVVHDCTPG